MKSYFLLLFTFLCFHISGQIIQSITASDIPGIAITRNDSFSGQGLYGFMDGGADLYFEYGFKKLLVTGYFYQDEQATLEVYEMADPPSAYGIYSLSVAHCRQWNLYGTFSCITPFQVAAVKGSLFINATNRTGTRSGQALCEQLVKILLDKNPREPWYAPPLAQSARLAPFANSLRYFKGPLGLTTVLPQWYDLFENLSFDLYTINFGTLTENGIIARIVFPDENSLSTFLMKAGVSSMNSTATPVLTSNSIYRSWYKISDVRILFLESNTATLNIKDFLTQAPDTGW